MAETIEFASIEYAAEHLHSRVLLVLGHEKCGAVTAATKGDELVHRGVEANVAATAHEILERSPLLSHLVKEGELQLVQAVYDLDSGQVRLLAGPEPTVEHTH